MKKVAQFIFMFSVFLVLIEIAIAYFFVKETDNFPYRHSLINSKHTTAINKLLEKEASSNVASDWTIPVVEKITYDPVLGWVTPGVRGTRAYDLSPPQGKIRISAFGDSFTYGGGVNNDNSWVEQINLSEKGYEVLNFGVLGYGLDQAYLRYIKEGISAGSHIVFIGYMSENIERHVNAFRPFYNEDGGIPLGKPRFKLINNELSLQENFFGDPSDYAKLINSPNSVLASLGEYDFHYQMRGGIDLLDNFFIVRLIRHNLKYIKVRRSIYKNHQYNPNSKAYKITEKIFDIFHQKVLDKGSIPIILLFPDNRAIKYFSEEKKIIYSLLIEHFEAKGYKYIDMLKAFKPFEGKYSQDELCPNHYTVEGNKIVADFIVSTLNKKPSQGHLNKSE